MWPIAMTSNVGLTFEVVMSDVLMTVLNRCDSYQENSVMETTVVG